MIALSTVCCRLEKRTSVELTKLRVEMCCDVYCPCNGEMELPFDSVDSPSGMGVATLEKALRHTPFPVPKATNFPLVMHNVTR